MSESNEHTTLPPPDREFVRYAERLEEADTVAELASVQLEHMWRLLLTIVGLAVALAMYRIWKAVCAIKELVLRD